MDKSEINRWLKGFVADLTIESEGVPLERVIATRLDGFVSLRENGLTWPAIAALIARAGGRRRDGKPISGDQLRAVVQRLLRRKSVDAATPTPSVRQQRAPPPFAAGAKTSVASRRLRDPPRSKLDVSTDKDVSSDEMALALARIIKTKV